MKKNKKSNFLFNFISPIYGLFYNSQRKHYVQIIENIRNDINLSEFNNIIDVGCGTGALCSALIQEGLDVTGVDPAKRMLKIGAKKKENKDIKFITAGTCKPMPFADNSFDISIASYVAHGIKEEERIKLYKEMNRVSKHYVILHDYNEKRAILTDIIEFLERGDYFRFIKNVKKELNDNFKSVKVVNVNGHAAWYICVPIDSD